MCEVLGLIAQVQGKWKCRLLEHVQTLSVHPGHCLPIPAWSEHGFDISILASADLCRVRLMWYTQYIVHLLGLPCVLQTIALQSGCHYL